MKYGIIADLHFGRGDDKALAQYLATFDSAIMGMNVRDVDVLIIAGDTFEKHAEFTAKTFDRIKKSIGYFDGKFIIFLSGNHDFIGDNSYSAVLPFHGIDTCTTVIGSPDIYKFNTGKEVVIFIPWLQKSCLSQIANFATLSKSEVYEKIREGILFPFLDEARKTKADFKLCVFHASVTGASVSGQSTIPTTDFNIAPLDLLSLGCDYCVGGHFHKRQTIAEKIMYVGSMERQDFGEADNPCGWLLIEPGKSPEFIELEGATAWRTWDFKNENTHGILEIIPEKVVGHIKIKHAVAANIPQIEQAKIEAAFLAAGAFDVVFEPVREEIAIVRVSGIEKATSLRERLELWANAAPENDADGLARKLFEYDEGKGFPEETNTEYFEKAMKNIT